MAREAKAEAVSTAFAQLVKLLLWGSDGGQANARVVWKLRGWTNGKDRGSGKITVQGFDLTRADGQEVPEWKLVEHRQDGRHRLGYNPAQETREIYQEEFEAVKATAKDQKSRSDSVMFRREGGDRAVLERQQKHMAKL